MARVARYNFKTLPKVSINSIYEVGCQGSVCVFVSLGQISDPGREREERCSEG